MKKEDCCGGLEDTCQCRDRKTPDKKRSAPVRKWQNGLESWVKAIDSERE